MFKIVLSWKDFKVNLALVEAWLRANAGSTYLSNQANEHFELYFSELPSGALKTKILGYWENIHPAISLESKYVSKEDIINRIEQLKNGLISKTWDQMDVAEKKIVLGQTPTAEELGLI